MSTGRNTPLRFQIFRGQRTFWPVLTPFFELCLSFWFFGQLSYRLKLLFLASRFGTFNTTCIGKKCIGRRIGCFWKRKRLSTRRQQYWGAENVAHTTASIRFRAIHGFCGLRKHVRVTAKDHQGRPLSRSLVDCHLPPCGRWGDGYHPVINGWNWERKQT